MRLTIAFVFAIGALLSVRSASAQDDTDNQARLGFERGVQLLDARQFREAASAFEESLALRDSPTARYNLALAYRGLRHVRESIETLRLFLADPSGTPQQMIEDAAHLLGEQERLLVRVTLRIAGPPPVEVLVDGDPVAPVVAQVLELDPGHHVFAAHAVDREAVRVERDLADGAHETVSIQLARAEDQRGRLEVRAVPPAAEIAIDGAVRGHGTFGVDLDVGSYRLRVSAAGYLPSERRITLRAGQRLDLQLALGAANDNVSATWVWVAVGITAVVLGTVIAVLAVALTSTNYAPLDGGSAGVVL